MFQVNVCCRKYTSGLVRAINMASLADKHLPVAGGLLEQSAWFIDLWNALQHEQNLIDAERMKRFQ